MTAKIWLKEDQSGPSRDYNWNLTIRDYKRKHCSTWSIMDRTCFALVVFGIAVPVTTSLNRRVPVAPNQITDDIDRPDAYISRLHISLSLYTFPIFVIKEQTEVDSYA